jgi:hypothetical protein
MWFFASNAFESIGRFDMPVRCLAYLDPGSGSMILQILVVGLAGLGVLFKYAGARILDVVWPFRGRRSKSADASRPKPAGHDDTPLDESQRTPQ